MENITTILSQVLIIPYIFWGVRMLSQRYRHHQEAGPVAEAVTLLFVLLFMAIEIALLKASLENNTVLYFFTVLGLIVSMAALYGHMAISLTSRLIVEAVSAGDDAISDAPRMGPVESLERQRDYEGALQECLVLARIYPRDASVHLHIAENLLLLKQPEEAANALERALKYVDEPEKNLNIVNRFCEVLVRELGQQERAESALQQYLTRYPTAMYADSVRDRLGAGLAPAKAKVAAGLARLEEAPMEEESEEVAVIAAPRERIQLDALEEHPQAEAAGEEIEETPTASSTGERISLSALEDMPVEEEEEPERPQSDVARMGLQALDTAPLEEEREKE